MYAYDDTGTRVLKRGLLGEVVYVNEHYALRNGTQETKQVFAGNTRVATKVSACGKESTYYYHGDHLGSSNAVTTRAGAVHEYLEYFPFGETWIHEKPTSGESVPYKFTSKELDPETGLYYFGARYYEPKVSRWVSADPALKEGKYFPKPNDFDTEHDFFWYVKQDASGKLPGIGGVFNAVNLDVYHYGGQNPVKLVDPDGKVIEYDNYVLPYVKSRQGKGVEVIVSQKFKKGHYGIDTYPYTDRSQRSRFAMVAVAEGMVIFAGVMGNYGNTVDILHGYDAKGNPVVTRYAHLSKIR